MLRRLIGKIKNIQYICGPLFFFFFKATKEERSRVSFGISRDSSRDGASDGSRETARREGTLGAREQGRSPVPKWGRYVGRAPPPPP